MTDMFFFRKVAYSLVLILFVYSLPAQKRIEKGDSLFEEFLNNSIRLGEIVNPDKPRIFGIRKIWPKDSVKVDGLSNGFYVYKEFSMQSQIHFFEIKNGALYFTKNDMLETILESFGEYCTTHAHGWEEYECFDVLWKEARTRLDVVHYK